MEVFGMKCGVEIFAMLLMLSSFLSCLTMHIMWTKGRHNSLMWHFFVLQILLLIWTGGDLSRMLLDNYQLEWLITRFQYGAICFIGWVWLVFCLNYAESAWLTKRHLVYLALGPLACYIAVLTNDWHHCFFLECDPSFNRFGFLYYLFAIGSYVYCVLGVVILVRDVFQHYKYLRIQTFFLIVALAVPLALSVSVVSGFINDEGFDYTPLCFNFTSLLMLIGMIRFKLKNIMPIALRKIVAQMREIVVVVDNNNHIIEYNQAAKTTFAELSQSKIGENLFDVLEKLQIKYQSGKPIEAHAPQASCNSDQEVFLDQTGQWFYVTVQPVYSHRKIILGYIISLNDITEYKRLECELQQKNGELVLINRQLQEQAAMVEELAAVKERDRVVRDIHDTLGQTMTLLMATLQLGKMQCCNNPGAAEIKVDQAIELANKAILQTRQALYGLVAPPNGDLLLSVLLPNLISEFADSGMQVELNCTGVEYSLNRRAVKVIYHLCQEGLTNALRHGKATHLTITLDFTATQLTVGVRDDGLGCAAFEAGIGLSAMKQRIQSLNGRISFDSHPQAGFAILVEIPKSQLVP